VAPLPLALPSTLIVWPEGMVPDRVTVPSRSNEPVPALSAMVAFTITAGLAPASAPPDSVKVPPLSVNDPVTVRVPPLKERRPLPAPLPWTVSVCVPVRVPPMVMEWAATLPLMVTV
jgi:hypothetical protein